MLVLFHTLFLRVIVCYTEEKGVRRKWELLIMARLLFLRLS